MHRLPAAQQVTPESYRDSSNTVSGISVYIINHLIKIIRRRRKRRKKAHRLSYLFPITTLPGRLSQPHFAEKNTEGGRRSLTCTA